MNFEEEKDVFSILIEEERNALSAIIQGIESTEKEIQKYLYDRDDYNSRKKHRQLMYAFETIAVNEFNSRRQNILSTINSLASQLREKYDQYDDILREIHYIQYQMLSRMDILKNLLVASQSPKTTIQSIYDAMNSKYPNQDIWHKEFSQEFYEEVESLRAEDDGEEKARIFVNTTVSELSNALLRKEKQSEKNATKWNEISFNNYPALEEAIDEVKQLRRLVCDAQTALVVLQNNF